MQMVRGEFRVFETLRHKIEAQFLEYTHSYRERLLDSAERLHYRLGCMGDDCESKEQPIPPLAKAPERQATMLAAQRVNESYRNALLAQSPVAQIEVMLAANLRNLSQLCDHIGAANQHGLAVSLTPFQDFLRHRAAELEMRLAQVRADVGLVQPVLEAAHCAAQASHGQMVAELAMSEATENQLRAKEGDRREIHNRGLAWIGLWIGLNHAWLAWIELTPEHSRPQGASLLAWVAIPSLLCGAAFMVYIVRNLTQTASKLA